MSDVSELYSVSVRGPDDIVATANYPEAVALANWLNAAFANMLPEPFDPNWPLVWASPGVWPYDTEGHERNLKDPGDDYRSALAHVRASRRILERVRERAKP